jgi:nicotinate-nucleotide pyrophosphorylase (carboxylating)
MTLVQLIEAALHEDMPHGDLTTDALALAPRFGQARLIAKQDLSLSGTLPFDRTMLALEPEARIQWHFKEGDEVLDRQVLCHISGDLIQILKAERVALNFVGHLSGIATLTRRFVKQVAHTNAKILDTRKTLPGYRELEKKAVVHGGGHNHRFGLSDAVLIKDNHILVAGSLSTAVSRIREHTKEKLEVECSTLDEVREAVSLKVERILLDNMNNELTRRAIELIPDETVVEASGNMSVERVKSVADLGVDYISVGAITHSAPTADISLLFDWQESAMSPI